MESGTGKVNPSDFFGAPDICEKPRFELLELVNIVQGLSIEQDGLAPLNRDER